jgi:hypothetical protein
MLAVRTVASASQSANATVAAHRTGVAQRDVEQRRQSDDPDAGEQLVGVLGVFDPGALLVQLAGEGKLARLAAVMDEARPSLPRDD